MKSLLLFGVHMHQPVDNINDAVESAVKKCYAPFFRTLREYPDFKFSLHCSGWLFEKIKKDYPKVFENIKYLVDIGSIELFSGGFYEPVLSSIPSVDRIEQIEKLNSFLYKEFKKKPKGLWLTERVWENTIIKDLKRVGIEYCMVDDYHFISSGFDRDVLNGYYITEDGGDTLGLFPISKELRYAIPFKESIEAIKSIKDRNGVAIIFDDLEKFGLWPNTYEWVYEKGWLREFLERVLKDKEIEPLHFSEYFSNYKQKGLAYIPNSSYYEMGEWSLKSDDAVEFKNIKKEMGKEFFEKVGIKFLKGGIWKNFFIKYEESNRLHKRVLECSKNRLDDKRYLEFLYKAECNDVFWHGIFGGLYLPNLRDNTYRYIIECENLRYKDEDVVEVFDNDFDGFDEVKVVTKDLIVRFYTRYGGQMIEFDDRKTKFNWQNVLTRREEAYHKEALDNPNKESHKVSSIHEISHFIDKNIKESIVYDWYIKNSFIDHIVDESISFENFKKCNFLELGDFVNQDFKLNIDKKIINFKRDGTICHNDNIFFTTLNKKYICKNNKIEFNIDLDTKSSYQYFYGVEFNFHFANSVFINEKDGLKDLKFENIKEVKIYDSYSKKTILISLDSQFNLFSTPIKTLSQNENGVDFITQGVSFILLFSFKKSLSLTGALKVEDV